MVERNGARILARLAAEGWTRLEERDAHIIWQRDDRRLVLPARDVVFAIGTAYAIAEAAGWIATEE